MRHDLYDIMHLSRSPFTGGQLSQKFFLKISRVVSIGMFSLSMAVAVTGLLPSTMFLPLAIADVDRELQTL